MMMTFSNKIMKITLQNHHHIPSASMVEMITTQLKSLQSALQIDEARVRIERSLTASPPFKVFFHLVTPGPDVRAGAADHTLRAALLKAFAAVSDKIDLRHLKRARRHAVTMVTAFPRRMRPRENAPKPQSRFNGPR